MTTTATAYAPTCPQGHGPMRRGPLRTGLWPSYLWVCQFYKTCACMEAEPAPELPTSSLAPAPDVLSTASMDAGGS